jgi:hypothetical protein
MQPKNWIFTVPLRLRSLFRRPRADQELDDELRDHVELKTEEYVSRGMAAQEARRMALLDMGGIEKRKEECRDTRHVNWLQDLLQDLRYGLRMLRKSPCFTAIVVLTLALGIGANTAIFSIVDSLLLRPLPAKDPGQLTVLAFRQGQGPLLTQFSAADLGDIRAQASGAFSDMLGHMLAFDGVSLNGKADRAVSEYVTGNFFSLLGMKPYAGRFFLPSEGQTPGADPITVLSHGYWKTRFEAIPISSGKESWSMRISARWSASRRRNFVVCIRRRSRNCIFHSACWRYSRPAGQKISCRIASSRIFTSLDASAQVSAWRLHKPS